MGQGFLGGALLGTVCGVALLGVATQTVERRSLSLPQPQATAVEVPGGSEFDQARPESDPVVPGTTAPPTGEEIATGVTAPEGAVETPPAFDTSSLEIPQPSTEPSALGELPELQSDVSIEMTAPDDGGESDLALPELPSPEAPAIAPATGGDAPETLAGPEAEDTAPVASAPPEEAAPDLGSTPDAPEGQTAAAADAVEPDAPLVPEVGGDADATPVPDIETAIAALTPPSDESPAMAEPELPAADAVTAPEVSSAGPEVDLSPAVPETDGIAQMPAPAAEDDAPVIASIDAPELPGLSPVGETEDTPSPEPETPVAEIDTPAAVAPEALDEAPETPGVLAEVTVLEPTGPIDDLASDVTTDRLPRIGDEPAAEDDAGLPTILPPPGSEVEEDVAEVPEPEGVAGAALALNRATFDNPQQRPLLAIVLVHQGDSALSAAQLETLPEHVSFAVDAGAPNAQAIAKAYKSAGKEVVLIPSLPAEARPQDVEVALAANFEAVPQAVAVMDAYGDSFQSNRSAVAQVVDIVDESGHGLITFPRGLNTAHQRAEQAGVKTGLIFKDLDGAGETGDQIRRSFDRAAFRARQDNPLILVGKTAPTTMAAIVEWSLGSRAASVKLAPVSAVLGAENASLEGG